MEFPEESLARAEEGNSELNHQVYLPIVYASNKGRGELPTRHLPSRSTSVCSFIVKCRTLVFLEQESVPWVRFPLSSLIFPKLTNLVIEALMLLATGSY